MPLSSISAAHEELPFELRALEIGLDTVSQYLERLTGDLEAAAHPALDALTGKVWLQGGGWRVLLQHCRPPAWRSCSGMVCGVRCSEAACMELGAPHEISWIARRRRRRPPPPRRSTPATWSACGASRTGWCG